MFLEPASFMTTGLFCLFLGGTMRALFTYHYGTLEMSQIESLGYEILYIREDEIEKRFDEILSFDPEVLVCYNPFQAMDIKKMNSLKWIQLSSIGVDQVPRTDAIEKNIIVTNNKGGYSIPIGEWIIHQMLNHYKFAPSFYEMQGNKSWKLITSIRELKNRKALFVGTGTISREAVKRLKAFEVECFGINTNGALIDGFKECYPLKEIDSVLGEMDFVIIALPETVNTHGIFDEKRLLLMKEDAVLINISRGGVINEGELIKVIQKGHFLGVSLDVFKNEPLDESSELWEIPRVIITPHNSWVSEHRNTRRFDIIFSNMMAYIKSEELLNKVNLEKGY